MKLYDGIIKPNQVIISGTPQFDFHFSKSHIWSRTKLYAQIGLDDNRPYILYTTGMASDFPHENLIIEELIYHIKGISASNRPQIVVRTYIKGISKEMLSLMEKYKDDTDIVFPVNLWNEEWIMPLYSDINVYSNLLRHTILGINTASTITIELMIFNKPAINIGFEPPNTDLPDYTKYSRHINYEHYRPVANSGGVFVAKSLDDFHYGIDLLLNDKSTLVKNQKKFINKMFNKANLGHSSDIIAESIFLKTTANDEK